MRPEAPVWSTPTIGLGFASVRAAAGSGAASTAAATPSQSLRIPQDSATGSGPLPVASTQPARIRAKPTSIPALRCSLRIATPSTAATAGLTYVITVARTGPTSAISAKKTRNASAVHTTASPTTDSTTCADGIVAGHLTAANGAYRTAAITSDAATTPSAGTSFKRRERMIGPIA